MGVFNGKAALFAPPCDTDCDTARIRFEFADEMDLSKFVSSAEEGSTAAPAGYKLASVIVHMGTAQIGHYISIVRANGEEQWMRFDDDSVVPVPEKEVGLVAGFPLINGAVRHGLGLRTRGLGLRGGSLDQFPAH